MSMFHELMMKKKEEIMYATIKGSLTENDGVFSGFSASNYLVLQDDITEIPTDFEIQTRISIPATNSGFAIHFLSYSGNSSGIRVFSSGKLNFYSKNNDNNAVEIIGTTVLSLDTFYFIKIKKVGNTITLYSSTDKITWTTEGTTTTTSTIPLTSKIGFGHCGNANNNNYIFNGNIDLNNSYIKLGSTKYNLQAVVGYTVVGSPTITNGVVSGFQSYPNVNSGYYVKIANFTYNNTFEMKVKIKTDSANFGGTVLGQGNPAPKAGIDNTSFRESNFTLQLTDQNNQSIVNIVNVNYIDSRQLTLNTDYILTLKFTGTEYIYTLVDMNGTYYINRVISSSAKLRVGCLAFGVNYADVAYSAWSGAIDMNETWIKTDNKLFFNGQQA